MGPPGGARRRRFNSDRARFEGVGSREQGRPCAGARGRGINMRVLVACEESQAVTIELRRLGHEAYSCDIQECSGGHPEWHIRGDALELLKMRWDMIIAHPPCTYLTVSGNSYFNEKKWGGEPSKEKGCAKKPQSSS